MSADEEVLRLIELLRAALARQRSEMRQLEKTNERLRAAIREHPHADSCDYDNTTCDCATGVLWRALGT